MGKHEGMRPLERTNRRWEYNIKIDLQEVGCGDLDWIRLAEDRDKWRTLVNAVMNLRGKTRGIARLAASFSRRTVLHGSNEFGRMSWFIAWKF